MFWPIHPPVEIDKPNKYYFIFTYRIINNKLLNIRIQYYDGLLVEKKIITISKEKKKSIQLVEFKW